MRTDLLLLLIPSQSQLCSFFVPGFYIQEQLLPTHTIPAQLFDAMGLTLFFEDANNTGLSHRTGLQLAVEGITEPKDFKEFDDDGMTAIFTNLLKPPKVPALSATACAAGTLREIQAYEVSAKSKMRLKGAMLIAQFYDNIGHPLDPDNMLWSVIKQFLEQWKALMERKEADHGQSPKLTKNQAVHKWVDSFILHLSQKVGGRWTTLSKLLLPLIPFPLLVRLVICTLLRWVQLMGI